jgi:hypothetical protein
LLRQAGLHDGEHASEFHPERWLNQQDDESAPKSLAFGAGPRFCPGRNLAFLESKAAIAMIARNFTIELDDSHGPVKEAFHFAMVPKGLRVRLHERSSAGGAVISGRIPNQFRKPMVLCAGWGAGAPEQVRGSAAISSRLRSDSPKFISGPSVDRGCRSCSRNGLARCKAPWPYGLPPAIQKRPTNLLSVVLVPYNSSFATSTNRSLYSSISLMLRVRAPPFPPCPCRTNPKWIAIAGVIDANADNGFGGDE